MTLEPAGLDESLAGALAVITSLVPVLGGAVSTAIGQIQGARQQERLKEFARSLDQDLYRIESKIDNDYVRTEDFEETLLKTLTQIAEERDPDKRQAYKDVVLNLLQIGGSFSSYEQERFLWILPQLHINHLKVLHALNAVPSPSRNTISGSIRGTLRRRVPDLDDQQLDQIASDLSQFGLADLSSMGTNMTPEGAERLRSRISALGNRFLAFLGTQ